MFMTNQTRKLFQLDYRTSNLFILFFVLDYDKTIHLSDKLLLSACGEPGDTTQFAEFIAKNVQVRKLTLNMLHLIHFYLQINLEFNLVKNLSLTKKFNFKSRNIFWSLFWLTLESGYS